MEKKMLLFRRNLKTVLFLAVLSICSSNVWAQNEVETGLVRLQYVIPDTPARNYLGDVSGGISVNDMLNENVFLLDAVGKGRYIMTLGYEENEEYTKGLFIFRNTIESFPVSDEVAENCYFNSDPQLKGLILTIDAIRIGSTLYITGDMQINDITKLDELAEAGSIKKIELNETNNFIFSFSEPENSHYYPDNTVIITSEIGGDLLFENRRGRIGIDFGDLYSTNLFYFEQVDDPNDFDNILYRRLNFGNGDKPGILEFNPLGMYGFRLYENSGDYLNADNQSDRFGSCGGRVYNKYENGEYKRDSIGNVISFLGMNIDAQYPTTNYSFYVDTAYINRGTGPMKPQYMLAVDTHLPEDTNGEYVIGRYMYNASMYVRDIENPEERTNFNKVQPVDIMSTRNPNGEAYKYQTSWDRLAFAWAIHKGDSLYVLKGIDLEPAYRGADDASYQLWMTLTKEYGEEGKYIDFSKLISENIISGSEYQEAYYPLGDRTINPEIRTYYDFKPVSALSPGKTIGLHAIIALDDNTHKDWVFSFRTYGKYDTSFAIESETTNRYTNYGAMIAPGYGGWVLYYSGVPVITKSDDKEIYDLYRFAFDVRQSDSPAVSNKAINTETSKTIVIGGTSNVTILNAAGKKVTISDILGRTISNTTASSDNVSIATPSGIMIVTIEGEKATKVIVK